MTRDRRRNQHNIKSKRVVLVSYEGNNKTERNYFDSFKGIDKNYTIKVVPGNETDPVILVKQTIEKSKELKLDLNNDDRAYCIFDTDINTRKNIQIKQALDLARDNNITLITSSPCIEVWFLLHYEYTTANMNSDTVIKRLKCYYPKYTKNCNMHPIIIDKVNIACNNAKKLEKYHIDNSRVIESVEANPHSDVYKIIEELNSIK